MITYACSSIVFCKPVDITGYPELEEPIRAQKIDIHWLIGMSYTNLKYCTCKSYPSHAPTHTDMQINKEKEKEKEKEKPQTKRAVYSLQQNLHV